MLFVLFMHAIVLTAYILCYLSICHAHRFTVGQQAEKQLISSAAVASRKRRSLGNSIRRRPSVVRASHELLLPTVSVDQTKLVKSSNRLRRGSLDSVVIPSSSKGLSPSRSYQFSVPDRRRNSPSIGSHISKQEEVSERNGSGGFHFSAPQALGVMQNRKGVTSEKVPCPETNFKYRKLEPGPLGSLPWESIGQPCPLKAAVSPNLLEQISIEILERKKSEDTRAFDEDFLLKSTKEEKKKKGSPSSRKIPGSHSRRSSSYRLALQPPTNPPDPSHHFDDVANSDKGPPVAAGNLPLVEPPQKSNDHVFPTIPKSAPLPRRQVSKMTDEVAPPPKCSEIYAMPAASGRRGPGRSTPKMTGSSSSPIGYVRSQVKKISEQFFQSPVSEGCMCLMVKVVYLCVVLQWSLSIEVGA